MSKVSNRIYASEMEYSPAANEGGNSDRLRQIGYADFEPSLTRYLRKNSYNYLGTPLNRFLGNGARLYKDLESTEYATPEDNELMSAVANEIVGEEIIQGAALLYSQEHKGKPVFVYKRNTDDEGNSTGYHGNYSADATQLSINTDSLEFFGTYATVRTVLFGAGGLKTNGRYVIGQKAVHLDDNFGVSSTKNKPVVHLRDEPHAHRDYHRRVHDVSGDALVSPGGMALRHATNSLVIRLTEAGLTMPELRFSDPIYVVSQKVTHDPELKARYRLKNGTSVTALGALGMIVEQGHKLDSRNGLSEDESWALDKLDSIIFQMQRDKRRVARQVEWVLKEQMLIRQKEQHGWPWRSPELRAREKQFGDLGINGIGKALRETEWADDMPSESLLKCRKHTAPPHTRANIRGQYVRAFSTSHAGVSDEARFKQHSISWDRYSHHGKPIMLNDPFETSSTRTDSIIKGSDCR